PVPQPAAGGRASRLAAEKRQQAAAVQGAGRHVGRIDRFFLPLRFPESPLFRVRSGCPDCRSGRRYSSALSPSSPVSGFASSASAAGIFTSTGGVNASIGAGGLADGGVATAGAGEAFPADGVPDSPSPSSPVSAA